MTRINKQSRYNFKYGFNAEDNTWIGVIIDRKNNEVITVGVEFTEDAIKNWCEKTLVLWPKTGREVPDAYDRRS